jgi:hypothetical protein
MSGGKPIPTRKGGVGGCHCFFLSGLTDLFAEWNELYPLPPPLPPPPLPLASSLVATELINALPFIRTYTTLGQTSRVIAREYKDFTRVMSANNDRWHHGSPTSTLHYPPASHQIFAFDYAALFDETQFDGSYGTYMTDSPRILEIHAALAAATYATDPVTGAPRKANLGHYIEKIANFIGYRPEPDGSIDIEKEKTTYASAVVNGDFVGGQDYYAGRFGKKGLYVKRLPNKMGASSKWEPGGIVKIHDLPQLHTELFGQLNQALNLQDSTSITIKDGSNTHNYPNQLALLIEICTGVLQHRRQISEIWASSIVTQKTANEILSGFGLPVVSKALTINGQQLPYWGVEPSQSLQKEIATSTYQGGAQLGQLL